MPPHRGTSGMQGTERTGSGRWRHRLEVQPHTPKRLEDRLGVEGGNNDVCRHGAHRVAKLQLGRVVEVGTHLGQTARAQQGNTGFGTPVNTLRAPAKEEASVRADWGGGA